MKIAVTLTNIKNKTKLFNGVIFCADGEKTDFRALENALKIIKEECNAEANRNGLALSSCEIKVEFK